MVGRFFCFGGGGGGGREADWAQRSEYLGGAAGRARVLELLEEELEARFAALGRPICSASQDNAPMRRLYQANLPAPQMSQCKDLLYKLATIDRARQLAEEEHKQLQSQLQTAEAAHRQAEFARARAEAIATARGEALMHAQQAHREAEGQVLQLAEWLKQALQQLGLDVTPLESPRISPPDDGSMTPGPRQSVFSKQQLAAVAASISKLPRQGESTPPPQLVRQPQRMYGREASGQHEPDAHRPQRGAQDPQPHAREGGQQPQRRQGQREQQLEAARHQQHQQHQQQQPHAAGTRDGKPQQQGGKQQGMNGFVVYTNGLQSPEFAEPAADGAATPDWMQQQSSPGRQESTGSGVQWRSISSAALSCRSAEGHAERQHQSRQSTGSAGSTRQASGQGTAHPGRPSEPPASSDWPQPQGGRRLQQHAHALPKLAVPGMDTSQPDSLVHIGASVQSPDLLPRTEVVQQLPPANTHWNAHSDAPGLSEADAQRFLAQLRADWEQRRAAPAAGVAAAAGAGSKSGSKEASLEPSAGRTATSQKMQQQAAAKGLSLLGVDQPWFEDMLADGKVPGAGTWVSPSLAAMIAHKKGFNPFLESGEPSPPSHIKAVFGTSEDKEFYGPMAAHLNKQPQEVVQRAPAAPAAGASSRLAGSSAQVAAGRQRQPHSNCSSVSGGGQDGEQWEGQQPAPAPAVPRHPRAAAAPPRPAQAGAAGGRGTVVHSSSTAMAHSQDVFSQQQQQQPELRQAAFLNRFQPMGAHAQQAGAPLPPSHQQTAAPQRHQQQQDVPTRHSSLTLRQLGLSDENLAAAALNKSLVRGSGQRGGHQAEGAATKRSLDSMRASLGCSSAANNISESMNAVETAMAALRDANPHLRSGPPPRQQPHPAGRASDGSIGTGREAVAASLRHARASSLTDIGMAALSDSEGWQLLEQQRRRSQHQAAAAQGRY